MKVYNSAICNYEYKEYDPIKVAYFAGIMDGEGTFFIGNYQRDRKNGNYTNYFYQQIIKVSNTEEALIDWLVDNFGGWKSTYTPKQLPKNSRKQVYSWSASGDRLAHLCQLILPLTVIKKRQVEIMLEMRDTYPRHTSKKGVQGIQRLSQETLDARQKCFLELRSLHNRSYKPKNKTF